MVSTTSRPLRKYFLDFLERAYRSSPPLNRHDRQDFKRSDFNEDPWVGASGLSIKDHFQISPELLHDGEWQSTLGVLIVCAYLSLLERADSENGAVPVRITPRESQRQCRHPDNYTSKRI